MLDLSAIDVVTAASVVEKIMASAAVWAVTLGLGSLVDVNVTQRLNFEDPAAAAIGAAIAVPAAVVIGLLFLPNIDSNFTKEQLKVCGGQMGALHVISDACGHAWHGHACGCPGMCEWAMGLVVITTNDVNHTDRSSKRSGQRTKRWSRCASGARTWAAAGPRGRRSHRSAPKPRAAACGSIKCTSSSPGASMRAMDDSCRDAVRAWVCR